jgi:sugar phosphate isomerase/epimerase
MVSAMRYAICNETFENWDHADICATAAGLGYVGLEVAPFTLAPRITDVSAPRRQELKKQAEGHGIPIIGLHWLLAKTEGFQLTATDSATRQRTADYLGELAKCCRDLGGDVMVFGSPLQRKIPAGHSREQAVALAVDTFNRAKSIFADTGVKLCLEPLAPAETDFIQTADEAVEILRKIDHPNFILHLDVKAMSSEPDPIPDVIRRHAKITGHFHANDANRRGPGFGDTDFTPIFQALKDTAYKGYVSVEVFDYTPDPVTIARESIRYMREVEAKLV